MSFLSELIKNYAEGRGVEAFGPGWREKIAQLQAQVEGTRANTRHTDAETVDTGVVTEGRKIKNKSDQFSYDEARKKSERIKKLVEDKYIPVEDPEALSMHNEVEKNTRENREADPKAAGSRANLNVHHAGYFDRMPAETGGGNGSGRPRLVQGANGVWEMWYPGSREGVPTNIGLKPTDAQLQRTNDMAEALNGARALFNMYNNPAPGNVLHQGVRGAIGKATKNIPFIGGMLNSEADLEADRQTTSTLLSRVYALSGKQINENEFKRLADLLVNRSNQPQVNKVNSRMFLREIERIDARWAKLLKSGLSEEQATLFVQNDNPQVQPGQGVGNLDGDLNSIFGGRK